MTEVTIKLFAFLQDRLGPTVQIEVPTPVKVAVLFDKVSQLDPQLSATLANSRLAVNQEFVDSDEVSLTASDEIAIIPPVSGG
nr:MoaD/ThiS family protein [Limosilactobacillus rudii]